MKHIKTAFIFAFVAMMTMTLTSCNDDMDAQRLAGYWEGEVSSQSWRGQSFNYVDIWFAKDPTQFASGTGTERDYDAYGQIITEVGFNYSVTAGVITLKYDDGTIVFIKDWTLTNNDNTFTANFWYGTSKVYLSLQRISRWKSDTWRNNRAKGTEAKTDSLEQDK